MKILLVPWMLLLFGASLSSGHYIRDPEHGNPKVYQVREEPSGVNFVNPNQGQPTLRDILYYHIIERPREDPASTERSFTNGHGYQFLDPESLSEDENEFIADKDTKTREEEESESSAEAKPLTDEDVKEAYKTRSYRFDQMRQRYAVKRMAVPDSLNRKKRQAENAEMQPIPDAPSLSDKDTYVLPKTYGMNLNSEGGYVWNNLNKPTSYYELGPSNGNSNEGQYTTAQSQENIPQPSENTYIPPETSNLGSSEDIYVNTDRPSAMPLETLPEPAYPEVNNNPEPVNDNPVASDSGANYPVEPILGSFEAVPSEGLVNNPIGPEVASDNGANYPVEPVISNDKAESNEGIANNPIGPEVYENPEQSYPVEPIVDNPGLNENPNTQEAKVPQPETPISEGSAEPVGESNENPGLYGQPEIEEPKPQSSSGEKSEGEKIKEMPEAPTLPPLNYENLPDYIRDAISITEKPASDEKTDNSYINPKPSPDDKKAMEDKMEDMFATMPPVEDIPKTYGMNLTSDRGHVWNDMVNPPVSYDVGTLSNPDEEHKEEQTKAPIIEQPEIHEEHENPIPELTEPESEEPIANPEEPNQEPETHESKETDIPIQEPNPPPEPTNEGKLEEPIANPEEPNQEPETHESEETDNPVEEPNPLPEPTNEGELEEPIANPNQERPEPEQEPEPEIPEVENKPIEEPAEPEVIPEKPELIPENPELIPENPELIPENPELITENPELIPENPEVIPEPGNDNHELEVTERPGDVGRPGEENGDHLEEPENEPVEEIPEEENIKPDIMSELLRCEQFWKWLGEWTATYMELLEKHIRKIAIQELCKREKSGEQMCPLEDNPEDTGVVIKDGKIVVDGREIEMTHTDNLDSDLKRHQNNKHENKGGNENKIEASTIYGNSVGNEKVTNVFIFTADKAKEVIDKLKPPNNSEVDFVIDDRIKEEEKEDESNVEQANKESNEGVNKKEPNNEEADKESNKGEATSEVIKEESNEGEVNKESNVTEANTEELDSEEAKKESNEGEATKEEDVNEDSKKKENNNSKPVINEEGLIKDEESKSNSGDIAVLDVTEVNTEELNSEEAKKESNKGEATKEEDVNEDSKKKENNNSKPVINEEGLIKYEESKGNSGDIAVLDVTEANTEELNSEEAKKQSNEGEVTKEVVNEDLNKKENNDSKPVIDEGGLIKGEESKGNSGDIAVLDVTEANTEELNSEEAKKESNEGEATKEEDVNEDSKKKENDNSKPVINEEGLIKDEESKGNSGDIAVFDVTEANTEELNIEEAKKESNKGEATKEEDVNKDSKKKENNNSKPVINEEGLIKDEESKGNSGDIAVLDVTEANTEELNSEEAKKQSNEGEVTKEVVNEDLNKKENNDSKPVIDEGGLIKDEESKGNSGDIAVLDVTEANTEELNIEEAKKESNKGEATKEEDVNEDSKKKENNNSKPVINEEGLIKDEESKGNSGDIAVLDVTEANTEELNSEEAKKESNEGEVTKEGVNEDLNKKENNDSKPVIDEEGLLKGEESKGNSEDIAVLDDRADDKSKLDSSEKNTSNSTEYLEKK